LNNTHFAFASFPCKLSVQGKVNNPQEISVSDLRDMPAFFLKDVYLVKEKSRCKQPDKLLSVASYKGVLLRDLLIYVGMKYQRKWEPGVFFRVRGARQTEVVFSFGEIFYSSIGRSILIAYEKNTKPIQFAHGCGELIVSTDVRAGRRIEEIHEIIVERIDVKLHAYKDKKKKLLRPPTTQFTILDHKTNQSKVIRQDDIKTLPAVDIPAAIMAGECEGFGGIYTFKGTLLKFLLEDFGIKGCHTDYSRYVLVASDDGFCAIFSFGEIFNSRLSGNIVMAYQKNGKILGDKDGFAMSVVREDSTGGRSVKRIHRVELF
jgi:hypothetical protein